MKHSLRVLLAVASLSICSHVVAQDRHDDRYYDTRHKDYHQWNAEEERHFQEYLKEKHRKAHDWKHASKREQQDYWAWRHEHGAH